MRASKRELAYAAQNFNEVHHTTLNPEGPGVVRIHLVPPLVEGDEIAPSVAILNGQDVIPVNTAWSILLTEFIRSVNEYAGQPVNDEEAAKIVPRDRLLIETDSPYLAPEPRRGRRNEPANVRYVGLKLAELRGETPEETAAYTTEDAMRVYGIRA